MSVTFDYGWWEVYVAIITKTTPTSVSWGHSTVGYDFEVIFTLFIEIAS